MTDIILTTEHDLLIESGDIFLFTELDKLTVQKVKIRLLNYRGEWFRDVNTGVPYLQQILGRRDTKDTERGPVQPKATVEFYEVIAMFRT